MPGAGVTIMALAIMISTFGCNNGLILAGARAYYAMARDGLFFRPAGVLNAARVPAFALLLQGIWAMFLILPRTYDASSRTYGNLYSNLLDYVISAALIFYILTVAAVFRLRRTRPDVPRPYRALGYPALPALYILGAATILTILFIYRASTTWPGLVIVLLGLPAYFAWSSAGVASRTLPYRTLPGWIGDRSEARLRTASTHAERQKRRAGSRCLIAELLLARSRVASVSV